jgi:putative aldouronate transport system permease protein
VIGSILRRKRPGEFVFDAFNILFMILLCALTLYPFLYVVSRSVMTAQERSVNMWELIPRRGMDFSAYAFVFSKGSKLITAFTVTLFRTVVGTALSVLVEAMFAYALSKKYFPVRNFLTVMIAVTLWFGAGLIPQFLLVNAVGLYDSIWVYVIVPLASAWNIFILRTFFSQIPESLEDSARIDGAQEVTILFRIIAPLSTAVLATIALFHIVFHWNEWFSGVIFVSTQSKVVVQTLLWQMLNEAVRALTDQPLQQVVPPTVQVKMAMVVVTAFPIVVTYPFFQKHFVKGMLIGSIKG